MVILEPDYYFILLASTIISTIYSIQHFLYITMQVAYTA